MSFILMIFKGKHNRKYQIRQFNNGPYQFFESGKWVYEMKGQIALDMMVKDIERKGGVLTYAASCDNQTENAEVIIK